VARVTRRRLAIALLCAVAVIAGVLVWALREPGLYRVTILPAVGEWGVQACSLNDVGQVVGFVDLDDGTQQFFLWDRKGGAQDLGPVCGDPVMIDNSGRICGTMPDPNGPRAFVWRAGKGRTVLDTRGGAHTVALAMNNRGQIAGLSYNANGVPRAFVWDDVGGATELLAPDGGRCWPQSINDAGQVLATSIRVPAKFWQWFLIDSNGAKLLDGVPPSLEFRNLNNGSCIAGVDEPRGPNPRLVFWQGQGPPQYVTPVSIDASLTRLNDRGQIACTDFRESGDSAGEAVSYLLDPVRGRVPLERYLRGMRFIVSDLNNSGSILGTAAVKDGRTLAVLLEPIARRWRK
jgi:probable HAF family extracellular repeat protein